MGGNGMDILRIIILSLGSIVVLFVLTKIMGDRQMSELSMFDYVNSITIGSIAAEMATSLEDDYKEPLIAMIVYGVVSIAISYFTCKSMVLRRIFEGHALIMYQNGKLYEKNLLKAKVDVDEFLSMCRISGYFDLEDINTAIMESNGKLSIIPTVNKRPVTMSDMNLTSQQNYPLTNIIIDGRIMKDNLYLAGKDEQWLQKQISSYGITDLHEIMLATCDITNNKVNVYEKMHKKMTKDIFE